MKSLEHEIPNSPRPSFDTSKGIKVNISTKLIGTLTQKIYHTPGRNQKTSPSNQAIVLNLRETEAKFKQTVTMTMMFQMTWLPYVRHYNPLLIRNRS